MSDMQFNLSELENTALIDEAQWERLKNELGEDMLAEFSSEYFEETGELWVTPESDPFALDYPPFKSLSHRSAGAAGTLGFKKLRYAFLCMEHAGSVDDSKPFFDEMMKVLQATKDWVANNS